jgi:probable rRNA maturation factor
MPIRFFSESTDFKLPSSRKTAQWIKIAALKEGAVVKDLNFIFCSDEYLLTLNQGYLFHNTLTDIITFDYSSSKTSIEGEIYISIDRVAENAHQFKIDFRHELLRVIIHGVLHLLGYKDKSTKDKALMRKKEDAYLSLHAKGST